MDATQVEQAVARLSAKLEALDLDQDERAVLEAICTAGAVAVEGADGEVEGFAFDASAPGPAGAPLDGSAEHYEVGLGLRKSAGGTVSGSMFLTFVFTL